MNMRFCYIAVCCMAIVLTSFGKAGDLWAQGVVVGKEETAGNEAFVYFDLGCGAREWNGYFAPDRWLRKTAGGQVAKSAAAPDLVQDARGNRALQFSAGVLMGEIWSIEIPAAGYLSFSLKTSVGKVPDGVKIRVNDRTDGYQVRSDGLYYSPYLKAGDTFSLEFGGDRLPVRWEQLLFHSNASGVFIYENEQRPQRRFRAVTSGHIERVFFLDDHGSKWPIFDRDGDPLTENDQVELRGSTDLFEVNYVDRPIEIDGQTWLGRTFIIREKCSRGNWLRRSRPWMPLPMIQGKPGGRN